MTIALTIQNISKAYTLGTKEKKPESIVEAFGNLVAAPIRNFRKLRELDTRSLAEKQNTLWALRDVSFDIRQGDVVGIVGRNGAGKSTLLKILSRITEPTSGCALARGRISSLLEVGTGFHPDLTGRENIFMNGTILGMSKAEIDRKFDEIVDFSGIEKFLDTPTKRYSSGMQVRLAFSVAAHMEPEILIVDEVLAVGDADFQDKCMKKMRSVASSGRTVILVSHNMDAISRMCNRAVYLKSGQVICEDKTDLVLKQYLQPINTSSITYPVYTQREGNGALRITDVNILVNKQASRRHTLVSGEEIEVQVCVERIKESQLNTGVALSFLESDGRCLFVCDSRYYNVTMKPNQKNEVFQFKISGPWLKPGPYKIAASLHARGLVDRVEVASEAEVSPILPYEYTPPPEITRQGICLPSFNCKTVD